MVKPTVVKKNGITRLVSVIAPNGDTYWWVQECRFGEWNKPYRYGGGPFPSLERAEAEFAKVSSRNEQLSQRNE